MLNVRNSISRELTVINMLVSAIAVMLACTSFFAYDIYLFRHNAVANLITQSQVIGYNSVSPLIFNDPQSAEKNLSSLQAAPRIVYAAIYTPSGDFFAGYWRDPKSNHQPLPLISSNILPSYLMTEPEFAVVEPIYFQGKKLGTVYIRSDLKSLIDRLWSYLTILGVILVLSLAAALVVSRISQRVISKPIGDLADKARSVSRDKNYAIRANPSSRGDEVSVLISAFNEMLSEIQKRDTALQASEALFRTLADSVPQLAWMAEPDGYVFWLNQRWYDYSGMTPAQAEGWAWQSLIDAKILPEALERWHSSIDKGQRFEMVLPLRRKDGQFREYLTLIVPVRNAQGSVARWFGTGTDITDQRRSEEALRNSEKLAATGRLAASIAHEINNPLEAVTNLIYLARKQPSNADTYLGTADQELERIAEITRHTLGFFRDTSVPVPVNISKVLAEVLNLYDRKLRFKKINLQTRLGENLEVIGFPGELRQVFSNLIANAVEAMNEGGSLWIKASPAGEQTNSHRAGVRVSFMDNGCGIDSGQMTQIFEPFYTTKKDIGTGLGLWLTHSLVSKHRGTIRVKSKTGADRSGTVFSIFLPREPFAEDHAHAENLGPARDQNL
jgi:PAS domain S-box-containing protein